MVTPRFLLDTDALSEPIRPMPSRRFMRRFEQRASSLDTTAVTWHEALFGARRLPPGRRRQDIESYLRDEIGACIPVLPYDRAARGSSASTGGSVGREGMAEARGGERGPVPGSLSPIPLG